MIDLKDILVNSNHKKETEELINFANHIKRIYSKKFLLNKKRKVISQ